MILFLFVVLCSLFAPLSSFLGIILATASPAIALLHGVIALSIYAGILISPLVIFYVFEASKVLLEHSFRLLVKGGVLIKRFLNGFNKDNGETPTSPLISSQR